VSGLDRRQLLRRMTAAGAGALIPSALLDAAAADAADDRFLRPHPRWRFVFVNHATVNPFFVPTRYGIEDADSLLGTTSRWTGSERSDVGEMVAAMNRAIAGKADGIALSIIDPKVFNEPTARALKLGIPVVAYNADGGRGNQRLAYVGQDLYQSGLKVGARIARLVGSGDVFIFIATPGELNLQPRADGALDAIEDSGKPIRVHVVGTGPDVRKEHATIEATYLHHKDLRGMFAVDAGSTVGIARVMRKYRLHARGVRGGGYDLLPGTLRAIHDRHLDFTIDQQPYLQGFLPILQLFFAKYSGGLVAPADTNTGLLFVTRRNVKRYLDTFTRYEGSTRLRAFPVD
jgi:simple sugar transport system substrate-binding protein